MTGTEGTREAFDASRLPAAASFADVMARVPAAIAVTRGNRHALVYGNDAFHILCASSNEAALGMPLTDLLPEAERTTLSAVLDRAFRTARVARNRRLVPTGEDRLPLSCSVWPSVDRAGETTHLVIELRASTQSELALALQREVAERLLLSAFREQDAAALAETLRRTSAFLAAESRRLAESLEEAATLLAMEKMALPYVGDWCIVDILGESDAMVRLAIVHPDPAKHAMLEELDGRWVPHPGDVFGLPAALRNGRSCVIAHAEVDEAFGTSARDPDVFNVVRELRAGPLLTVPLVTRKQLIGAVTFVGGQPDRPFTVDDIELAEDLASRSAMALDRARAYGEAVALKESALIANEAKTRFLGMMSHELRTPLNAIGGYVELMAMELHGPLTDEQRADLARIRTNQRYLMGLISDLLNFTRVGTGHLPYDLVDIGAFDVLVSSIGLVEVLIAQKGIVLAGIACDMDIVARGDYEKVVQILVNLLSNAIKFTPAGGELVIDYAAKGDVVQLRVCDTGIGIPPEKLDVIFDPFVQLRSSTAEQGGGIGLGLAISRGLARGMHGDLTVESTIHEGARFTLTLPRSPAPP